MLYRSIPFLTVAIISLLFTACSSDAPPTHTPEEIQAATTKFHQWLEEKFERDVMDSPEWLSHMGRKDRQAEWDDISEKKQLATLAEAKADLQELQQFDSAKLTPDAQLSYRLYKIKLTRRIKEEPWRHYDYPINQMHGMQSEMPGFLINAHPITDSTDAISYILRLHGLSTRMDQLIANLKIREEKGIIPPKFVFAHVIKDCQHIIGDGQPLSENIFLQDLDEKLVDTDLPTHLKAKLTKQGIEAVTQSVIPSYEQLVQYLQHLETKSDTIDGVWRFPDGDAYYQHQLALMTTTNMTANQVFELGKSEVTRIHQEMQLIMDQVSFKGTLQEFFTHMQTEDRFYFPDTPEGKQALLDGYKNIIHAMDQRLDELFVTKPKASIIVKAVEPYREQAGGKAFYQRGTPDGSRPGIFYANTYRMRDMPKYEMEALAYHEGIPGHHMQVSIAQELTDVPSFRKYLQFTAYTEGWGLYCELIPKEMGFYSDPYADFGRLTMELWRACRLVTDAGIHYKKWTRKEAITYLMENTPAQETACTKAIERYIVFPGQATAYKIGMIKILELRKNAKRSMGNKFDIRQFHDLLLRSGELPLDMLEERVKEWSGEKPSI